MGEWVPDAEILTPECVVCGLCAFNYRCFIRENLWQGANPLKAILF